MLTKHNNTSGFGLVETLVAIAILTIAISSTLSLARQGLTTASVAKGQIVGFYLAIEGMELVRNQRANSILNGDDWIFKFGTPSAGAGGSKCFNNKGCYIDAHTIAKLVEDCSAPSCPLLEYNTATNEYGYGNGGVETTYVRRINMDQIVSDQEVKVTVTVSWQSGSFVGQEVVLEETLFNWTKDF